MITCVVTKVEADETFRESANAPDRVLTVRVTITGPGCEMDFLEPCDNAPRVGDAIAVRRGGPLNRP
jgi:hypothetical protein